MKSRQASKIGPLAADQEPALQGRSSQGETVIQDSLSPEFSNSTGFSLMKDTTGSSAQLSERQGSGSMAGTPLQPASAGAGQSSGKQMLTGSVSCTTTFSSSAE